MKRLLSERIAHLLTRLGVDARPLRRHDLPRDFDVAKIRTVRRVRNNTLVSAARLGSMVDVTRYVVAEGVTGAIVEAGVWKGGAIGAAAHTLLSLGEVDRELWMYDTFQGMTPPTDADVDRFTGETAAHLLEHSNPTDPTSGWVRTEQVHAERMLDEMGYPRARRRFVIGDVLATLPETAPTAVAILRVDVDWAAATGHVLRHLGPLVKPGGFVVLDDHARWNGAGHEAMAFLERTAWQGPRPFLARVDEECCLFQVPGLSLCT